jgi:hypothetical protein
VRDRVYESGILTEDTLDWYAQDDQGNVWYLGEFSTELPSGDHTGSWTAGVDGAQPGYIMETAPQVGDNYCQENAPGIAQDAAQVISLTASRTVPYGTFTGNVLQTKDYSLIEPHSEYKYYAPGVGMLERSPSTAAPRTFSWNRSSTTSNGRELVITAGDRAIARRSLQLPCSSMRAPQPARGDARMANADPCARSARSARAPRGG